MGTLDGKIDHQATGATPSVYRVRPSDNVAVALAPLTRGQALEFGIEAQADIAAGHKVALAPIAKGDAVIRYGQPIGAATQAIAPGEHVHTHNLSTALKSAEARRAASRAPAVGSGDDRHLTFSGYLRPDGRVGTRNEIWILCTVGCVAVTAQKLAAKARERFAGQIDDVLALTHPFGCSQLGDDLGHTKRLLAALATHPNAGGVLVVGLGCESNQLDKLLASCEGVDPRRLRAFNAQQVSDEFDAGMQALEELVAVARRDKRTQRPIADLTIGLKCGGSDAFSGITANPLLGRIAERVTAAGGKAILTEIPEIFGAEHLLMERAADDAVAAQIGDLVVRFKQYFLDHGEPVHENPSPGNIAGGITTLEEKSLGAVQKGGLATVTSVLDYGQQARRPGLALLEAPGNDAVSSTALTAAGATVLLFTTGRGTPLGFPAPTLKLASNSALAQRKPGWIDFDAGVLLNGQGFDEASDHLMRLVLDTASGKTTASERNDTREIAIWKTGVTL